MKPLDKITEIIGKGEALRQSDMREIERLSLDLEPETFAETMPWIWEAIALIVNAPEYSGDIEPIT